MEFPQIFVSSNQDSRSPSRNCSQAFSREPPQADELRSQHKNQPPQKRCLSWYEFPRMILPAQPRRNTRSAESRRTCAVLNRHADLATRTRLHAIIFRVPAISLIRVSLDLSGTKKRTDGPLIAGSPVITPLQLSAVFGSVLLSRRRTAIQKSDQRLRSRRNRLATIDDVLRAFRFAIQRLVRVVVRIH
jgi:hypothetical protein